MSSINESSSKKIALTVSMGILGVAIVAIGYFSIKYGPDQITKNIWPGAPSKKAPVTAPSQPPVAPPQPPEEDHIFSYSGIVMNVNKTQSTITLATDKGEKTVAYSFETQFVSKRMLTVEERQTLSGAEMAELAARETPFPGDVKGGDIIIAESTTNIKGQTQFTASKVIILQ